MHPKKTRFGRFVGSRMLHKRGKQQGKGGGELNACLMKFDSLPQSVTVLVVEFLASMNKVMAP